MEDTLASPTVIPMKSTALQRRRSLSWAPQQHPPQGLPHTRDELGVVVRLSARQVPRPPGQEGLQRSVSIRADVDLVPAVPHLQAHQGHAEVEVLIELGTWDLQSVHSQPWPEGVAVATTTSHPWVPARWGCRRRAHLVHVIHHLQHVPPHSLSTPQQLELRMGLPESGAWDAAQYPAPGPYLSVVGDHIQLHKAGVSR